MTGTGDPEIERRFARAHKVASAVLNEGRVLYPYRASSSRNQMRWQWGVVAPKAFCATDSSEDWEMRTECIAEGGPEATIWVRVQFLYLRSRTVQERHGEGFRAVPSLDLGERLLVTFDESEEFELDLGPISFGRLHHEPQVLPIDLPEELSEEILTDSAGEVVGRVLLERAAMTGQVEVRVARNDSPFMLHRVTVEITNLTPWSGPATHRDEVVRRSFLSVHTLLAIESGDFISHRDPPDFAKEAVAGCDNKGTYPVLADDDDKIVLSSRIILDDHPEVAPESQGEFCDASEYDEILSLMVLTLSEEEKREARSTDAMSAAIIDRCDNMPNEVWERLHGAIRSLQPIDAPVEAPLGGEGSGLDELAATDGVLTEADLAAMAFGGSNDPFGSWPGGEVPTWSEVEAEAEAIAGKASDPVTSDQPVPWFSPEADKSVHPMRDIVVIDGVEVSRGSLVKLHPRRGADAQDLFVAGRTATVEGVLHDVDGGVNLALSLADDEEEFHQFYGRFLYFLPEECEPLPAAQSSTAKTAQEGSEVGQ